MHILGLAGMPRRVYTYQPELPWAGLNLFISFSSVVLAAGFFIFFVDMVCSWRMGSLAGPNPWSATTLEWATSSPPQPLISAASPWSTAWLHYQLTRIFCLSRPGFAWTVANFW